MTQWAIRLKVQAGKNKNFKKVWVRKVDSVWFQQETHLLVL